MSATLPQRPPDEDATLSGWTSKIRPWHWGVGIVAVVLLISAGTEMMKRRGEKKPDQGAMLASVGGTGEAWKAPSFPAAEPVAVTKPPSPLVQGVQAPTLPGTSVIPDTRMFGQQPPPQQQQQQAAARAERGEDAAHTSIAYKGAAIPGAKAGVIKNPALTLLPGMIPCTLVNAIDSSHAGPLNCIIPTTVYSKLGVPLMERGTSVIGSYSTATQGNHRIMAVSAIATTPSDIIVPLGGPMADELGRTGIEGNVNNHWWERFGPAVLLTLLNGGINMGTAYLQSSRNNTNSPSSSTYLNFGQSNAVESLAQEALRNSINIPPTIEVPPSATIGLWVLAPIDFSDAMGLKVTR